MFPSTKNSFEWLHLIGILVILVGKLMYEIYICKVYIINIIDCYLHYVYTTKMVEFVKLTVYTKSTFTLTE